VKNFFVAIILLASFVSKADLAAFPAEMRRSWDPLFRQRVSSLTEQAQRPIRYYRGIDAAPSAYDPRRVSGNRYGEYIYVSRDINVAIRYMGSGVILKLLVPSGMTNRFAGTGGLNGTYDPIQTLLDPREIRNLDFITEEIGISNPNLLTQLRRLCAGRPNVTRFQIRTAAIDWFRPSEFYALVRSGQIEPRIRNIQSCPL